MVSKRTLSMAALAVLVVLAGCGGAGSAGGGGGDGGAGYEQATGVEAEATAAPTREPAAKVDSGGSAGDGGGAAIRDDRAIIRTGTVVVEVDDFSSARSNLTTSVEEYGGYVSDSRQNRREIDNETWIRGEVVLRVPSENFDALVDDARALGEVESIETNSRDVTDQLVDIEARLENLRAERDRLRTLYDRANTTEDVLAVQRELSDVQQEIERLEARQQSLQNQVAFSTLTVRLEEPRPTPDRVAPDRWYDTPILSALLQSIDGVAVVARALVVGFAYALPYLVAFGIPVALVGGALLRYGRRFRRGGREPE
ncbi:DUF4349 domain-containing protein [Halobellus ruber]|uniref:DUF4349 domain-containing protein n=1 Tax=Halobellus ruber TaxID=2761102 RepID=A0A7J9SER0_9EURY|nr:DUF4349 domain-containing protein [Halobellus ruber]MBB6645444.1 DUF4349 domain-containing protein [Halobellus ruber]